MEALKKQWSQVHTNFEFEIQKSSTLSVQLETERKKLAQLEDRYATTLEEGRDVGVREFLKFDDFMANLAILNTPILKHGYA